MALPYENATSGDKAVSEIRKILMHFGATRFGVMEDSAAKTIMVQFEYRGRPVSVTASIQGYAAAYLRENPWTPQRRLSKVEYERRALVQAGVSVYSVLRDWIKGQVTAIETQILTFEGAFLGQIMLPSGQTVLDRVLDPSNPLLPNPDTPHV